MREVGLCGRERRGDKTKERLLWLGCLCGATAYTSNRILMIQFQNCVTLHTIY